MVYFSMVLKKYTKEYFDEYMQMCEDFFSSDAVISSVPRENFINTFNAVCSNNPLCDGYIIKSCDTIVGYTNISFSWNNDLGGKVLWLEEIYIKKDFRSFGYGKKVFEFLENNFGCVAIRLEVDNKNQKAISLYENIGFKKRSYTQFTKEL